MKDLRMIEQVCKDYLIEDYEILSDGRIDVYQDVDLEERDLT